MPAIEEPGAPGGLVENPRLIGTGCVRGVALEPHRDRVGCVAGCDELQAAAARHVRDSVAVEREVVALRDAVGDDSHAPGRKVHGLEACPPPEEELAAVGLHGYYAGPAVHIIDQLGLCDPLLARLPSAAHWRIGHFYRGRPAGYRETIATGVNHLQDPRLIAYYNRLATITRGPILNWRRFQTIARMNLGEYDALLVQSPGAATAVQ